MNIFMRTVEAKSFAAAARSLLLDPAAVSRAIKALEGELGVPLFARSTRALRVTPEGDRFYGDCRHILGKIDEAMQQFRAGSASPRGQLKIGMTPGVTRRMLLRAIPAFQRKYPLIDMVLLSVDDTAAIGDGTVDVLLRPRALRQRGRQRLESQGLVARQLVQSRFVACASVAYLDRFGMPRVPSDLLHHACVGFLTLERDVQDEWHFAKSRVRQRIKFTPKLLAHGIEALRESGLAGCGIIRLLACHVDEELRAGQLVPILAEWECIGAPPIMAIYRKTRPSRSHVRVFVRHLADTFRPYDLSTKSAAAA